MLLVVHRVGVINAQGSASLVLWGVHLLSSSSRWPSLTTGTLLRVRARATAVF